MECSYVQLLNLPDEILMIIFKKLDNVEVLYSLMDVNMRFNKIVRDPTFTSQIALMKQNSSTNLTSPLSDIVLDRFCLKILPQIHEKIKSLKLETLSMKRVLLAVNNYPNLHQLDIFIMNKNIDMHLFTSKIFQLFTYG
jgi:hypothetical protein